MLGFRAAPAAAPPATPTLPPGTITGWDLSQVLDAGSNELVVAVTEYTGGWAFWTRLDDC